MNQTLVEEFDYLRMQGTPNTSSSNCLGLAITCECRDDTVFGISRLHLVPDYLRMQGTTA